MPHLQHFPLYLLQISFAADVLPVLAPDDVLPVLAPDNSRNLFRIHFPDSDRLFTFVISVCPDLSAEQDSGLLCNDQFACPIPY